MILIEGVLLQIVYHGKEYLFDLQSTYSTVWPGMKLIMLFSGFVMLIMLQNVLPIDKTTLFIISIEFTKGTVFT